MSLASLSLASTKYNCFGECILTINRLSLTLRLGLFISPLLLTSFLFAQSTTSMRGIVADPSGGVIPEAIVSLTNEGNGARRNTITNSSGEYQFLQVTPGAVTLEKPGFATLKRTGIQLLVNTPTTLDLSMVVSSTGDSVNVASEVSQVNTTDATVGNPFGEKQVRQLPLETRNVVELLSLQPGVTRRGKCSARAAIKRTSRSMAPTSITIRTPAVAQATGTSTGYQGSNANGSKVNRGLTRCCRFHWIPCRSFA